MRPGRPDSQAALASVPDVEIARSVEMNASVSAEQNEPHEHPKCPVRTPNVEKWRRTPRFVSPFSPSCWLFSANCGREIQGPVE